MNGSMLYCLRPSNPVGDKTKASSEELAFCLKPLVPVKGVEPSTFSLQVSCSTN